MTDLYDACYERTCKTSSPSSGNQAITSAAADAYDPEQRKAVMAAITAAAGGGLAAAVAGLNVIAEDPALRDKLRAGDKVITKQEIDATLLLDKLEGSGRGPAGPHQVRESLTPEQKEAVEDVLSFWNKIGGKGIEVKELKQYKTEELSTTVGKAASNTVAELLGKLVIESSMAIGAGAAAAFAEAKSKAHIRQQDTATLETSQFKDRADKLFFDLDKDHNGFLDASELGAAAQDSKYQGQDAQVISALYKRREDLQKLSNDEFGSENDGITRNDLAEFGKIESQRAQKLDGISAAKSWADEGDNFKKADKDGDGFLDKSELDSVLQDSSVSEYHKKGIRYLRENYSAIEDESNDEFGPENDGITRADLNGHYDQISSKNSDAELVGNVWGSLYRTSESQRAGMCTDLYADKSNPLNSIKPDAVKQGYIGDCYFLSSLSALAASNPEKIRDMIKDNGDGSYTVTFPGDSKHPVTVKAPTDAEMGAFNGGSERGMWAVVLEKAYGKYRADNRWFFESGVDLPQEAADGGGQPYKTLELLTGKSYDTSSVSSMSDAEIANTLDKHLNGSSKTPVGASVRKGVLATLFGGEENSKDGYPTQHAYSIVGFEPDGKGGGMVIVRNPWGGADGTTSGTKKISIKEFRDNFSELQYAE